MSCSMISSLRLAGPIVAMIFVCRMFDDSLHRNEPRRTISPMNESVRGRAKRVLVVGASGGDAGLPPAAMLAPDGLLIVMESDAARATEMRRDLSRDGLG